MLELALPLRDPSGCVERREIRLDTAFGGPGARDGFELVTRAVSDGRFTLAGERAERPTKNSD